MTENAETTSKELMFYSVPSNVLLIKEMDNSLRNRQCTVCHTDIRLSFRELYCFVAFKRDKHVSIHEMSKPLMEEVAHHLSETSVFSRWTRKRAPEEAPLELARRFAITTLTLAWVLD